MTAPASMPVHVGAVSLKKPHHIATYTIWFSEVVNDHPPNNDAMAFLSSKMNHCAVVLSASFFVLVRLPKSFFVQLKNREKKLLNVKFEEDAAAARRKYQFFSICLTFDSWLVLHYSKPIYIVFFNQRISSIQYLF